MRLWSNTHSLTLRNLADRCRSQFEIVRAQPKLAGITAAAFVLTPIRKTKGPRILVGTHHKVLTVFMMQVFRDFARITDRRISVGMGDEVDYSADIIFDHHSQFDFSRVDFDYLGVHFRRDPRDVVISAGFYHKRSKEPQLHVPRAEFWGKTYQEYVNSLESMEDVFLFELDHSAGMNIRHMLEWDYGRGFLEFKFEELVTPEGGRVFREGIDHWPLPWLEKSLLESLFKYHSVFSGDRSNKKRHVRDPRSKQFQEHFSEKLQREFDARFAEAPKKLGYT